MVWPYSDDRSRTPGTGAAARPCISGRRRSTAGAFATTESRSRFLKWSRRCSADWVCLKSERHLAPSGSVLHGPGLKGSREPGWAVVGTPPTPGRGSPTIRTTWHPPAPVPQHCGQPGMGGDDGRRGSLARSASGTKSKTVGLAAEARYCGAAGSIGRVRGPRRCCVRPGATLHHLPAECRFC